MYDKRESFDWESLYKGGKCCQQTHQAHIETESTAIDMWLDLRRCTLRYGHSMAKGFVQSCVLLSMPSESGWTCMLVRQDTYRPSR